MEAPSLKCVFGVNMDLKGWEKMLNKIFLGINGLKLDIDASKWLVELQGEVDPIIFIAKLYKARAYVMLCRIDYGYEDNPKGTRKPTSDFMRCRFDLNILDISWYKKIIGALKTIQGVSFAIDTPPPEWGYPVGYTMGYLRGNIEIGVLMKMLRKTSIHLLGMKYGAECEDANLEPPEVPPKKLEASPNVTETQPEKDTVPPPLEVVSTSTKHQVVYKKPGGFRRFCSFLKNHVA
ncbi:hypothetical protein AALP_AA3G052400 [Arabis alpina]|uniref:Uncharacterized protein n=1 Tax=Arabis alpina TaxID=50452 RepID=A0A087H761_ARAAL|nr:hypothetical protein AALP_AA3G052400 [Arabis alpina]